MNDADVQQSVESWLNKTGFPLEMRLARAFRDPSEGIDWSIETNTHYVDQATDTTREVDLSAYTFFGRQPTSGINVGAELTIECKSGSNPWVIMKDDFQESQSLPMLQFAEERLISLRSQQRPGQLVEFSEKLNKFLRERLPAGAAPGYGLAEAFKNSNSKDMAYSATQQVLSATLHGKSEYYGNDAGLAIDVFIPIIVTTSPLFEASLDGATGRIATRAVKHSAVWSTAAGGTRQHLVYVYSDGAIDQLLAEVRPMRREVETFLELFDRRILAEEEGVPTKQFFGPGRWHQG